MGNYCVAWLLLVSYVALLGLSGFGIGLTALNFGLPVLPPPVPPTINETTVTTPKPQNSYDYSYRYNTREPPKEVKDYGEATRRYADYHSDPASFLVCPCGVSALLSALLVLTGICSRKNFSKTVGLYSSLALWILTLVYIIVFQNNSMWHTHKDDGFWAKFTWVLGIQIGMLSLLSLQIILAIWELKRQKIAWPALHFSHLFTLNTVFLVTRITVSSFALISLLDSDFWHGLRDDKYQNLYDIDYWSSPRIRYPEYYVYPVTIAILFDIVASLEGLLSHLTGYVHMKMLCLSSVLTSVFYGGIIVLASPAFVMRIFGTQTYPDLMNWAIGAVFACFIHAVASFAKPEAMTAPPTVVTAALRQLQLTPSLSYNSDGLRSQAAAIRNRFKGSDTLLLNTVVLVFSGIAIVLISSDFRWSWGPVAMLCGNVAMIDRILPVVMMEVLTRRVESVPVFKMLMHFLVECVLLVAGICGSFPWFYGTTAGAGVINGLLVALQLYKLVTNPAIKAAATNLAEQEADGSAGRRLVSETDDVADSPSEDGEGTGRIYQPLP